MQASYYFLMDTYSPKTIISEYNVSVYLQCISSSIVDPLHLEQMRVKETEVWDYDTDYAAPDKGNTIQYS